jgi:hypothetical protein
LTPQDPYLQDFNSGLYGGHLQLQLTLMKQPGKGALIHLDAMIIADHHTTNEHHAGADYLGPDSFAPEADAGPALARWP